MMDKWINIDGLRKPVHTKEEVEQMMSLPLNSKIFYAKMVIEHWYEHWSGKVFVAFSGGKDSTVLLHLVRSMYPDVKAVFSNTGLEYPEIMEFAKSHANVEVVAPKKKFNRVLQEDGFPITNKKQARIIGKLQNPTKKNFNSRRLALTGYAASRNEYNLNSRVSKKWIHLAFSDVRVTDACCDYLKKDPMAEWKKANPEYKPFVGMMMGEGRTRDLSLGLRRCNVFEGRDPSSVPLKFWTDADVYAYAEQFGVEICSVYKDYDLKRTGCTFCAYGAEMEDPNNNRFTKLKESHPKQFNAFINKMGMAKALDYAGINYGQEPQYEKPKVPSYQCDKCGMPHMVYDIGFITEREWTQAEEESPNPLAGMNLYCPRCAELLGLPVSRERFAA